MKIPAWIIVLIVMAVIGMFKFCGKAEPKQPKPADYQRLYDSIINVVERQDKFIAYQDSVISHRDTIIKKEIEYVKTSSEATYRLNPDSSYKLFILWTKLFQDSGERARYLHTDSNGFYQ